MLLVALVAIVLVTTRDKRIEKYEGMRVVNTKRGRGVMAAKRYEKGDVVDVCPLLVGPSDKMGAALDDYVFEHSETESALALGMCSLFNHSDNPSVDHEDDAKTQSLVFRAARRIEPGEEMTVSYGKGWFKSRGYVKK